MLSARVARDWPETGLRPARNRAHKKAYARAGLFANVDLIVCNKVIG